MHASSHTRTLSVHATCPTNVDERSRALCVPFRRHSVPGIVLSLPATQLGLLQPRQAPVFWFTQQNLISSSTIKLHQGKTLHPIRSSFVGRIKNRQRVVVVDNQFTQVAIYKKVTALRSSVATDSQSWRPCLGLLL